MSAPTTPGNASTLSRMPTERVHRGDDGGLGELELVAEEGRRVHVRPGMRALEERQQASLAVPYDRKSVQRQAVVERFDDRFALVRRRERGVQVRLEVVH